MSLQKQFEGPDVRTLLDEIHSIYGAETTIARAERYRTGGMLGFFQKENYRLTVDGDALPVDGGAVPAAVSEQTTAIEVADPFAELADAMVDDAELGGSLVRGEAVKDEDAPSSDVEALIDDSPAAFEELLRQAARSIHQPYTSDDPGLPDATYTDGDGDRPDAGPAELGSSSDEEVLGSDLISTPTALAVPATATVTVETDEDDERPKSVIRIRPRIKATVKLGRGDAVYRSGATHPAAQTVVASRSNPRPANSLRVVGTASHRDATPPSFGASGFGPAGALALAPAGLPAGEDDDLDDGGLAAQLRRVGFDAWSTDAVVASVEAGASVEAALFGLFSSEPPAPQLPDTSGSIVAVVGPAGRAAAEASRIAREIGAGASSVLHASIDRVPNRSTDSRRIIRTPEEAAALAPQHNRWRAGVIAIDAPLGAPASWTRDIIEAVGATHVVAIVDALHKTEDVAVWVTAIGGVDTLVLDNADRSTSPARVFELDIPVTRLGQQPASSAHWTAIVIDRVEDVGVPPEECYLAPHGEAVGWP